MMTPLHHKHSGVPRMNVLQRNPAARWGAAALIGIVAAAYAFLKSNGVMP